MGRLGSGPCLVADRADVECTHARILAALLSSVFRRVMLCVGAVQCLSVCPRLSVTFVHCVEIGKISSNFYTNW